MSADSLSQAPEDFSAPPAKDDVLAFIKPKVASWWLPDDVRAHDLIPLGDEQHADRGLHARPFADVRTSPVVPREQQGSTDWLTSA